MTNKSGFRSEDDPSTWSVERIADEVAYVMSEVGRPHVGPREIAFALEIKRLSALLALARKYGA